MGAVCARANGFQGHPPPRIPREPRGFVNRSIRESPEGIAGRLFRGLTINASDSLAEGGHDAREPIEKNWDSPYAIAFSPLARTGSCSAINPHTLVMAGLVPDEPGHDAVLTFMERNQLPESPL
jgi:hypothetical protein